MSGLVIVALGFQLLICSAASAAHACSGTIDRIPGSVAHAFREIVDRHSNQEQVKKINEPGYRLRDGDLFAKNTAKVEFVSPVSRIGNERLLNLPPPMMG